jgi:acetamidase/formamidase/AraC-like DNA-binding protein
MTLNHSQFTTDAYPGDRRVDAWRDALGHVSLALQGITELGGFHGQARSVESPLGITFTRLVASAQNLTSRTDQTEPGVWIALHLGGSARFEIAEGRTEIATGDFAYGPLCKPWALSYASDFRTLFVLLPKNVLSARGLASSVKRPGLLRGNRGIGRVFADMLGAVAEGIETMTSDQLRPVEIAVMEFFAASLAGEVPRDGLRAETGTQMSILNRICQIVEAHLGEADFSRATVARKEGISARYVQRLFENAGDTFSHYLRRRRLERCRSDLISPALSHLSITEISYCWGFNDSAHFSRAFREEYGASPREFRKQADASSGPAAPSQIGRGWPEGSGKVLRRVSLSRNHEWLPKSEPETKPKPKPTKKASIFSTTTARRHHYPPATEKTVHWGYFSKSLPPVLVIGSGDLVTLETLTHHASDDFDRMIKGDAAAERIFHWTKDGKTVDRRGAGPMNASIYGRGAGEGFGVHLCTGPIAIADSSPGDVVELRILNVRTRPSANLDFTGRSFGSNAATWWGFHYKELLTEPKPREVVTIYEIDCQHDGCHHARAAYSFRWTPQRDPFGVLHPTIDYPGVRVDHSTVHEDHEVLKGIKIPLRPHFGVIGLAPKEAELVDSIPPSYFGGNLDNWRAGEGASIFLPVSVAGGLLSVGDPHASQGDSELCGTAIECSLTGTFQVILHKKGASSDKPIGDLDYPLLETDKEWVIHGFSHANYLGELGDQAQSEIYKHASLDPAMRDAFWKMRRFLMTNKGLSEDEAISLISVAVDFGITQVVDGNLCVHALLRKELFE